MSVEKIITEPFISQSNAFNLFELSGVEFENLKHQVVKSNNKIRVLIHPFFESDGVQSTRSQRVTNGITKLLKCHTELPIIVFEEFDKCHYYHKSSLHNNNIYVVPTLRNTPTPRIEQGWKKVIEIFKKAEIKKILIGGRLLEYHDEFLWGSTSEMDRFNTFLIKQGFLCKHYLGGCVVSAGGKLLEHFDLEISHLTDPLSKMEHSKCYLDSCFTSRL